MRDAKRNRVTERDIERHRWSDIDRDREDCPKSEQSLSSG
jgi:hypothetical protein